MYLDLLMLSIDLLLICEYCVDDGYLCVFFKQKTAYEMRISDWSSDVCSSDLSFGYRTHAQAGPRRTVPVGRTRAPPPRAAPPDQEAHRSEIGRASCRERVCQYV